MAEIPAIARARGLSKRYGRKQVLHGIDFTLPAGRIYGLLGQNGAGKTTTLNALLGLSDCDGQIEVLGLDPFRSRARLMNQVAFIADVASLPRYLKVGELFALVGDIHPGFDKKIAHKCLQGTELQSKLKVKIKTLSKGMLAQLHLAIVMAIKAKLLVLDEPTLGLDIVYRKRFYQRLLDDYMNAERTLLIATHQVDEIEFMLTDVMILHAGKMILDMPVKDIGLCYTQLLVEPDGLAEAERLQPVYTETRFGQTAMVFEKVAREQLEPLGSVSTPNLSDLFVTLMQRHGAVSGAV